LARYLALDWDHKQIHVVLANVGGGAVRVLRAATWAEEAPLTAADAVAVGERLKERLKEMKIAAAPVIACLGRERIIVKDIRYPAVPPHEEPAVVRFQAVKELTGAADESVIDYFPAGETPAGERRAMVLVAKREQVNAYQELCKAAGLKLAAVTPRPFGLATCVERLAGTTVLTPPPEPADAAVATLAVADGWAEICVSRGSTLLLARSLVPGPNLAAEVRRSLAVYAGQAGAQPVRAAYVSGGADNAALRERLHNLTDLPVHLLDPFAGSDSPDQPAPDKRGGFVALVGLLHLRGSRGGLPVNFAAPKQPRPPEDPNRRKLVLGAAVAAAVLVAVGMLALLEISKLDRQIKEQTVKNQDLDKQLAAYEDDDKRVKAIAAWADSDVVWLDELYDFTDRFPDPDKDMVRLTTFTGDAVEKLPNAKEKDKDKHVARISLKGVSNLDDHPLDHMLDAFRADHFYAIPSPPTRQPNRGPDRLRGYTQDWTVPRIDVDRRKPEEYKRHFQVTDVPERKERAERPPDQGDNGRGRGRGRGGN
jgi:Tfp pilus assembly PilM family ATPase